jgi:putative membrane protein insertion efficiency factor
MSEGGRSTKKVSEQRFTCNACGKVWHVSTADLLAETGKALMCCGGCLPAGAMTKELGRCPECGSRNVKQERVEYEVDRASVEPSLQASGAAEGVVLSLLRAYKAFISPALARYVRCRFYPSCSAYAMIAVQRYGWLKGSAKATQRLARCHPRNRASCIDLP